MSAFLFHAAVWLGAAIAWGYVALFGLLAWVAHSDARSFLAQSYAADHFTAKAVGALVRGSIALCAALLLTAWGLSL